MVAKAIRQHNYVVYYMRDAANSLQYYNEDVAASADNVIAEIQELLPFCTGQYVNIEIRKVPIGNGEKGGNNATAKMSFKVLLNASAEAANNKPTQAPGAIPGMPTVYELFQNNQALQMKMFEMQLDSKLQDLKRERDEYKDKANSPVIDRAVDKIIEKLISAEDAKEAATKAINKQQNSVAIADENKTLAGKALEVKDALARLKKVDNNLSENLIFLADYAEKNPIIYNQFLKNLKQVPGSE
jgi:uncharacterized protein YukE